jgi:hypothetical protein
MRGDRGVKAFSGLAMVGVADGWTLKLEKGDGGWPLCAALGRLMEGDGPQPPRGGMEDAVGSGPLLVTEAVLTGPGGGRVPVVDGGVRRRGFRGTQ